MTANNLYEISAPGQIITFSYQLFACIFVWMNRRRFSPIVTMLLQLVLCSGIVFLAWLWESPDYRFYVPRLFLCLAATAAVMYLCMDEPLRKCLYFLPIAFTFAEFTTALEWHLYYYGTAIKGVPDLLWIRSIFFAGVYGGMALLTLFVGSRFRGFHADMSVSRRDLIQVYLLAMIIFLVSNISNVTGNTPFSSVTPSYIFMIRTLVDFAGVITMYLLLTSRKEAAERRQSEGLRRTMQQMYDNYRLSRESVRMVSEKYHDLKHQLAYLRNESSDEKRQSELDQLEREIKSFEAQADTGNEILDTIVMSKRIAGAGEGIGLTCIADGSLLSFMSGMDLSALFGNLLDNAVEAVLKIPDRKARLINLSVEAKRGFAVIICENRCAAAPAFENGLPQTDKADRENHGFGVGSIRAISEKYGGSACFFAEEGWFRAKVLLPLPEER